MGRKRQLHIIKSRPSLRIRGTRDSVSAGDDCDAPHEITVSCNSFLDPNTPASHLSSGYLPGVDGTGHLWECALNGKTIARITSNETIPIVDKVNYGQSNHIHFTYHSAKS